MTLLRIFIPTWRFFDRIGDRPRAWGLYGEEWRPLFTPPVRRWWRALFNPAGNLHHANQNLTVRLAEEVASSEDVSRLVSYRLLTNLARVRGASRLKITARDEDILISPELT